MTPDPEAIQAGGARISGRPSSWLILPPHDEDPDTAGRIALYKAWLARHAEPVELRAQYGRDKTMNAGRELDTLVADRVMGWKTFAGEPGYGRPPDKPITLILDPVPPYSTAIAAAWQVLEELGKRDCWLHELSGRWEESWRCIFAQGKGYEIIYFQSFGEPTAPLAICRAALAAVGYEEPA